MNTDETEKGASVKFPPPLVPIIAIAVGWVGQIVFGDVLPIRSNRAFSLAVGAILIVLGLTLVLSAIRLFRESGQDPAPWKSSPEIIGGGIYRLTRNPMYLGMGVIQAGIGLMAANVFIVVLVPVTWFVIYMIAIRHEEEYLTETFGQSYLDYKNSVRRWI